MPLRVPLTLLLLLVAAQADAQEYVLRNCGMRCNCSFWVRNPYYKAPQPLKFVSTPPEVVTVALAIANPQRGEVVYDLGCGDGRVLIEAAGYNVGALGIEIDPQVAAMARKQVAGYSSVTIQTGDATRYSLNGADVIYLYQSPEVIAKLKPMRARCVISYMHDVPQLDMQRVEWTDNAGQTQLLYVHER